MDMDKRTILGLLLIGLVIVFMYSDFYRDLMYNGQPAEKKEQALKESKPATSVDSVLSPQPTESMAGPAVRRGGARLQDAIFQDFHLQKGQRSEEIITINTPLYRAEISSRGPSIISWRFKKFLGPDSLPYQLVYDKIGNLSIGLPVQGDTLEFANMVFEIKLPDRKIELSESNPSIGIPFRYDFGDGQVVTQTIRFYYDQYSIDMSVALDGVEKFVDGYVYTVNWMGGMNTSEAYLKEDMQYAKTYALTADKELEEFDLGGEEISQDLKQDWIIKWAAMRTKYFTMAIIPRNQVGSGIKFLGHAVHIAPEQTLKQYSLELSIPYSRRKTTDDFTVYIGPLQYSIVKAYNVKLERMMNFGWKIIRPISKGVLWALTRLYEVIPNYGLVIVIFSILIKLLLFPLTKKSYKSMRDMQALQPKMQELKEKYANDPQKMNAEVMNLYREHGVNPVGGCLPMLLQMPLLYALFIVFRSTIELRGAPFFWWITDLSRPDTIFTLPFSIPLYGNGVNVLPLFMGITMFLQQKMTVQDPKQKAMVYFMPFLFMFIFNSFPSGLNLYYSLFNIFTIIQQKMIPQAAADASRAEAAKKKRRPKSRLDAMRQQVRGRRLK